MPFETLNHLQSHIKAPLAGQFCTTGVLERLEDDTWAGQAEPERQQKQRVHDLLCLWGVGGRLFSFVTLTCDILQFWQETVPELALLGSKHPECLWQASVKHEILLMFQREWRPICFLHTRIPETSSKEINQKVSLCMVPRCINKSVPQNNSSQKINAMTQ